MRCELYTLFKQTKTNSLALTLQANYIDWTTTTCRRNLVPTFVDNGVSHGQHGGSPMVVNLSFLDWSHEFSLKKLLIYPHEGECTPFQTHYYTENLLLPGIEPRTFELTARNSDH
jgi:hypothetical protein